MQEFLPFVFLCHIGVFCEIELVVHHCCPHDWVKLSEVMSVLEVRTCMLYCHISLPVSQLAFSVTQYLNQVIVWKSTCEKSKIPTSIVELEYALQTHQDLIENISLTYAEVGSIQR